MQRYINQLVIDDALVKTHSSWFISGLENLCKHKAFINSQHEYPFSIGFSVDGMPLIENLPDLGNILIFGQVGQSDFHTLLFAQMLCVNYRKGVQLVLFDDDLRTMNAFLQDRTISKCYIGNTEEFFNFLSSLEREAENRRKKFGEQFIHTIYFGYLSFHSRDDINDVLKEKLHSVLSKDLQKLGLQLIICSGDTRTTKFALPYAKFFNTTIGTYTYLIPEYSILPNNAGIFTSKGQKTFFYYRKEALPILNLEKGQWKEEFSPMQRAHNFRYGTNGEEKNIDKAIEIYESEAEKGDTIAAYFLYTIYHKSNGLLDNEGEYPNKEKEEFWLRRAAELGDRYCIELLNIKKRKSRCSYCGKEFGELEASEEFAMRNVGIKYSTKGIKLFLCPECTDKALDALLAPCTRNPFWNEEKLD